MATDADTLTELYNSRMRLKREMQRAIQCIKPSAKRKLAAEWKEKYSELFYRELISCAKNKAVCMEIGSWQLDTFEQTRKR